MLDIKFVRENPDAIDVAMANRQTSWDREKFFELDDERRAVITEVEELQATRNAESKKIGALMKEGKKDEAEAAKEAVRAVNEKIDGLAERRTALEQEQYDFMAHLPNIPCEATPYGKDEDENIERRRWGTPREFDFDFKPHWDLGTDLDILDFERGNKLSGSRFTVLGGAGAAWSVPLSTSSSIRTPAVASRSGGRLSSSSVRLCSARASCPSSRTTPIMSRATTS